MYHGAEEQLYGAALALARELRCPFIFQPLCHQDKQWQQSTLISLYKSANALIASTSSEREWLGMHGSNVATTFVIPPAPILPDTANYLDIRQIHGLKEKVVLFIGEKDVRKGYKLLLEAAKIVTQSEVSVSFVFIGKDNQQSLEDFKTLGNRHILNLGMVDENVKVSALRTCDIFCMPSTRESMGMTFLEAWAFSKPIIAADIPASRELTDNGRIGVLTELNPTALANKIRFLLNNKELCDKLGTQGHNKLKTTFSWERSVTLKRNLLDSLINSSIPTAENYKTQGP